MFGVVQAKRTQICLYCPGKDTMLYEVHSMLIL